MKVRDILALCSCRVDIYNNRKFIDTYEDYKDLMNIDSDFVNRETLKAKIEEITEEFIDED